MPTAQVPSSGPHNLGRVGPGPGPSWGAGAGLGDCGLFSASLFKAQLGVVPAGPSPPTAAAGRAARELGHCISHCCRDAGPGGPGCFPAQLWLFLHAPSPKRPKCPKRPAASTTRAFSAVGQMGPPRWLNSRVLELRKGTWGHRGEATAQWAQNPGLLPPAQLALSEVLSRPVCALCTDRGWGRG